MRDNNYISFAVVCGFFIGLILGIIKFNSPTLMLVCTVFCTVSIYIISLLFTAFYYTFDDYGKTKLNRGYFDRNIDYYDAEFDKKEKEVSTIRSYISNLNHEK